MTEATSHVDRESAELLAEEVEALARALPEPQRERARAASERLRRGEFPEDLVDVVESAVALSLQTGRARRRYRAEGERLLTQVLWRTPRGQALQRRLEATNRALQALRGRRLDSVRVAARTLGDYSVVLRAEGVALTLAARADGVELESVSVDGERDQTRGVCVWLTGLPGAGKSTLAELVAERLREVGRPVEVLDGDAVRQHFSRGLGFSREDRVENVRRVAYVAGLLVRHGIVVLAALISPYRDARAQARELVGPDFLEVYVRCPLDVLVARDPKGLYARALRGEIPNFTGVSDPYEEPESPDLVVDTHREIPAEAAARIVRLLEARGYLATGSGGPV
ncbi:MAG: adenylyl-sulfate kinase [Armatimonadota bacterium]|nr:adenylyl-sulfate kinase [Armatimonadota bacterium]